MSRRPKTATVYPISERGDRSGENVRSIVRWRVIGRPGTVQRSFTDAPEADAFHGGLCEAADDRERFDHASGLPLSMVEGDGVTIAQWCKEFCARDLASYAPISRRNLGEDLAPLIARSAPECAPELSSEQVLEIQNWLAGSEIPPAITSWMERWSPPLRDLERRELARILERVSLRQDLKTPLSINARNNRTSHVRQVLNDAVDRGRVAPLDWPPAKRGAKKKTDRVKTDRRVIGITVVSAQELEAVIEASANRDRRSAKYQAMTAIGGLAGLRPSEVFGLETTDLRLPAHGWGTLVVDETRVPQSLRWALDGDLEFDVPKSVNSERTIPIPPSLVERLATYIEAENLVGRLFPDGFGRRHWADSLALAAKKTGVGHLSPYDLRRTYASHLSAAGVPPATIAERMGITLKILFTHYIKPVAGNDDAFNNLINSFYGAMSTDVIERNSLGGESVGGLCAPTAHCQEDQSACVSSAVTSVTG
jgi:integrase